MKKLTLITLFFYSMILNAQMSENFSGVWQLDLKASDPIDNILKAQGKSRIEIMAAKNMLVTQSISHHNNILSITIKSRAINDTQDLRLDGQWTSIDTPKMGKIQSRSFWIKKRQTVVTIMNITAKGRPATMTTNRSLINNGQTMQLKIRLILENGENYYAKRIFRKI